MMNSNRWQGITTFACMGLLLSAVAAGAGACSASANDAENEGSDAGGAGAGNTWSEGDTTSGGDNGGPGRQNPNPPPTDDGGAPPKVYAPVGSPCGDMSLTESRMCGICGTQQRACLPGDGGLVWADWGACIGELPDGCDPTKQYADEDCGRCGKRQVICQNNCQFAPGLVCQEPAGAECSAGEVKFFPGLSCTTGGRFRTCDGATCKFNAASACVDPGHGSVSGKVIRVSGYPGDTVSGAYDLPAGTKTASAHSGYSPTSMCPIVVDPTTQVSYVDVEIRNDTGTTITTSVYSAKPSAGTPIDTIIAAYGPVAHGTSTPANRAQCAGKVIDTCNDANGTPKSCEFGMAGLMMSEGNALVIPPGQSYVVHVAAWDDTESGPIQIAARTE